MNGYRCEVVKVDRENGEVVLNVFPEYPEIKVGDVIKSFDFGGHDDCYKIGVVIGYGDDMLTCRLVKSVWEGKADPQESKIKYFSTPKPGRMMRDEYGFDRIVVLG